MARLVKKIENKFYPGFYEDWELDNGLKMTVWKGENCSIIVSNQIKDVSDQIFERLTQVEKFKVLKLIAVGHYEIKIEEKLLNDIIEFIEKIDRKYLEEGNSY